MMSITLARRHGLTPHRVVLAVLLLSLASSAMLLLTGDETTWLACVASAS